MISDPFAMSAPVEPLLTAVDVMRTLKISRLTLYRLVANRHLRVLRFFRHLRFRPEDVQSLIDGGVPDAK